MIIMTIRLQLITAIIITFKAVIISIIVIFYIITLLYVYRVCHYY